MPSFFTFTEGTESSTRLGQDAALLGRFRAVPAHANGNASANASRAGTSVGDILSGFGSVGYGSLWRTRSGESSGEGPESEWGDDGDEAPRALVRAARVVRDLWIEPKGRVVKAVVRRWWARWLVMGVLPAAIAVAWCALPFPQYPLPDDFYDGGGGKTDGSGHKIPGHGEARVQVNFWFFLFVYYGFYNLTALMWITKVFNIYSLNWWPQSIGFPITLSTIAAISIAVPIPLYYFPETKEYLVHNTAWIFWTFITMAMPVAVAFFILTFHERHLGLRQSLSDTQRIFTQSWWTNENDMDTMARRDRRRPAYIGSFDPDAPLDVGPDIRPPAREAVRLRKLWIPASFMRFIWFCAALSIGLIAYVLGETYAEIYLRTLPHNNIETIFYVYSWVITIHLLDGLTGWILGGNEGERVGSYPLGWVFKLYFSLTYQTYVRSLYARLRSPQQFMILQLISSSTLIIIHPLTMSSTYHWLLHILKLNNQPYLAYAKFCRRSIFIRTLSECVSMSAFLGQILVLHYGANRNVYPYFAFDGDGDGDGITDPDYDYDFGLTFYASCVTWACEIVAAWIVRRVVGRVYGKSVSEEGWGDVVGWPELVPTAAAVMVHVLQNMLFGIIRLQFH